MENKHEKCDSPSSQCYSIINAYNESLTSFSATADIVSDFTNIKSAMITDYIVHIACELLENA